MSLETLAAGQQLGAELQQPVSAAVLGGPGIDGLAAELAGKKLEQVYAVEHELLKDYTPDTYTAAVRQLVEKTQASVVFFPHTYQVRDFLPKLATALGRVLVSDVVAHRVEDGKLVLVRQLFQGKLNADVRFTGDAPYFASMQAGAFRADKVEAGSAAVEKFAPELTASRIQAAGTVPRIGARGGSDCGGDYRFGRPRDQGSRQHSDRAEAGQGAGRGTGGIAADLRYRLAADGAAGGQFRTDGIAEDVSGCRDFGGDPASGRDEGLEDDRGDQ